LSEKVLLKWSTRSIIIQRTLQIRVICEKNNADQPKGFFGKNPPKSEKALGLFWKKP